MIEDRTENLSTEGKIIHLIFEFTRVFISELEALQIREAITPKGGDEGVELTNFTRQERSIEPLSFDPEFPPGFPNRDAERLERPDREKIGFEVWCIFNRDKVTKLIPLKTIWWEHTTEAERQRYFRYADQIQALFDEKGASIDFPEAKLDKSKMKALLFELRDIGKNAADAYGFYEGSLLVLIEDLMPILKRLRIKKKEWKDG